jgi:hypothetical protein
MSAETLNLYVTKYENQVTHVFQPKGFYLDGLHRPPVKVEGNTVKFPIIGRGEAGPLQRGSRVTGMNASRAFVSATVSDYQAADWAWETDIEKINWDEMAAIAETCGMAIGRQKDKLIVNELNAGATTIVDASNSFGNTSANSPFTLPLALAAIVALNNNNVFLDEGQVVCIIPPLAWTQLMTYAQFSNALYVGYDGQPWKETHGPHKFKSWNGVMWKMVPLEYLPVPAPGFVDCFMWHKNALGFANNYEIRTNVSYENLYTGWLHNSRFAAVAKTLLPPGLVRIRIGTAAPITMN